MVSKVGIHSVGASCALDYARAAVSAGTHVAGIVSVNNGGIILDTRRLSPDTLTLWRLYQDPHLDGADLLLEDYEEIATARWTEIMTHSSPAERAATDFFVVQNEPAPYSAEGWRRLGLMQIRFMDYAEQAGLHVALIGLNCGTPATYEFLQALLDTGIAERTVAGGHLWAIHEGAINGKDVPPDADWRHGIGMSMADDGFPEVPRAGVWTCRYRHIAAECARRGIAVPNMAITEFYPTRLDLRDVDPASVTELYRLLDQEIAGDDYIRFVAPFTVQEGGPESGWNSQRHERVYAGGLLDYICSQKDTSMDTPTTLTVTGPAAQIAVTIAELQRIGFDVDARFTTRGTPGAVLSAAAVYVPAPDDPPAPAIPQAALDAIDAYASARPIGTHNGDAMQLPGLVYRMYSGGEWSDYPMAVVACAARAWETHSVRNAFMLAWQAQTAALGAPVNDEGWQGPVVRQDFERGWLEWSPNVPAEQAVTLHLR